MSTPAPSTDRPSAGPIIALAMLVVLQAGWLHSAPSRAHAGYLVFAVWAQLAVVWWLSRRTVPSWRWVLAGALGCRLVFVGTPPLLSDDLYRYLWEGLALNHDIDPFSRPPASIQGLDDDLGGRVNHPQMGSIYPPIALLWFRVLAMVGSAAWVAQAATALVDLGTVALLWRMDRRAAWVWAIHPLPILEATNGAHLDVLGVACLTAAILAYRESRPSVAITLAGLGAGVKLLPITLLPSWWLRGPKARSSAGLLAVAIAGLIATEPAWNAGASAGSSLDAYARDWSFNGALYTLMPAFLGSAIRPLLGAIGAGAVLLAWREDDPTRAWFLVAGAFILLTPTAHPWYGLWLLAPALLLNQRTAVVAASSMSTAYLVLLTFDPTDGTWQEGPWLWALTWLPPLAHALHIHTRRTRHP